MYNKFLLLLMLYDAYIHMYYKYTLNREESDGIFKFFVLRPEQNEWEIDFTQLLYHMISTSLLLRKAKD